MIPKNGTKYLFDWHGRFQVPKLRPNVEVGTCWLSQAMLRPDSRTNLLEEEGNDVIQASTSTNLIKALIVRSPILWESFLLSFPLATKMFQFAKLSLACPWIQQQFKSHHYKLIEPEVEGLPLPKNSGRRFIDTSLSIQLISSGYGNSLEFVLWMAKGEIRLLDKWISGS
ncbi:hypothetical protein LguiB_001668 [Lonicera macranthoides]